MIKTSYFGKMHKIDKDAVLVSVCAKSAKEFKGEEFKELAPSWDILNEYKRTEDKAIYTQRFKAEILSKLDKAKVLTWLENLDNGNGVVLLCFEKSEDFCHRHIIADWLGLEDAELKL